MTNYHGRGLKRNASSKQSERAVAPIQHQKYTLKLLGASYEKEMHTSATTSPTSVTYYQNLLSHLPPTICILIATLHAAGTANGRA